MSWDFSRVFRWRQIEEIEESLFSWSGTEIDSAKEEEIQNWRERGVFEEVDDKGQKAISARWIITEKVKKGKRKIKARLVARGFEEEEITETDSPTCAKEALRTTIMIIGNKGWNCNSIDIKTAYLQGKEMEREVYLMPPKEYQNGSLWKLKKTVYGLKDAAREWFLSLKAVLLRIGLIQSRVDSAIFFQKEAEELKGVLCIHVDDILWGGDESFKRDIIDSLRDHFEIGNEEKGNFKFLGVHVNSNVEEEYIILDQNQYIGEVRKMKVDLENKERLLTMEEQREYRSIVGQLNWISNQTRPDISFDVSVRCAQGRK